jgi:hypothetical protein
MSKLCQCEKRMLFLHNDKQFLIKNTATFPVVKAVQYLRSLSITFEF